MLAVENRGERLVPLAEMERGDVRRAVASLPGFVARRSCPPSIRVRTWDGRPVVETAVCDELAALGFEREDRSMILYRKYAEGSAA